MAIGRYTVTYEMILNHCWHIVRLWGCSIEQFGGMLNADLGDLVSDKSYLEVLQREQIIRMKCIVQIKVALERLFTNEENVNGFMRMQNDSNFFKGGTPLELIESCSLEQFQIVANHIKALSLGN
ncbi:hypothetical protein H320_12920 [Vibrio parahaemolyticus 49]|uniref:antitoxin Xre/MbcA/ParS toxin-binding domain-containing protein n=1 Tax=Vibrio parahaemolyticus TaxID=670 RepID=UPI0005B6A2F4|nr:antitoxin Xre/MbcA/ParS toxin-binding domain-containing protein [Vibrio parahaemolyticus]KIT43688.1 hypothetical protein H320_12920 [Vibrio parahaemolyticus 49]EGQ8730641.1 DUF2384 domain-containing protein [Vibrio parahaemolyticus]EGQ8887126.1 DUF2384 domain-containing protein [Vibrio parahaemolyticus]EGQ8913331.1 DUF2384 domain-containing protein [Vibrio parahaemolyticus]EGQ8933046.1 DUF2384 domain-containing protein [Vibrio parahaemolyticus]